MAIVVQLLEIYSWVIILSALSSWLPVPQDHPVLGILRSITEPVYAPIRSILNPMSMGGLDISPILVLLGIRALQGALVGSF
jgi:YggT family protein